MAAEEKKAKEKVLSHRNILERLEDLFKSEVPSVAGELRLQYLFFVANVVAYCHEDM